MSKIKKSILNGLKFIPKLIPDILAISGVVTISYGAFLFLKPLGYIVLGVMLIAGAVLISK